MAENKIIISGFGGQGIVLAGNVIAQAALLAGKNVVGMVSYGAEVRGGTSSSSTIISDDEIASPVIDKPDIVIALNQPSVDRYAGRIKKGGYLVVNSSLVKDFPDREDINLVKIPATEIANKLGNIKAANIVAIGGLFGKVKLLPMGDIEEALNEIFKSKKELIELNKKAFMKGVKLG